MISGYPALTSTDFSTTGGGARGTGTTPLLLEDIGRAKRLMEGHMAQEYQSGADVLFVYDTESFYHTASLRGTDPVSNVLIDHNTLNAFKSGVVFDPIHIKDLERVDLTPYRVVVFGNTYLLDREQREYIRSHVATDGRTLVWFYAPGYLDGSSLDVDRISELTGIELSEVTLPTVPEILLSLPGSPAIRYRVGEERFSPLFAVADLEATVLGTYAGTRLAAVGRKIFKDHSAWYVALPNTGIEPLRSYSPHKRGTHLHHSRRDRLCRQRCGDSPHRHGRGTHHHASQRKTDCAPTPRRGLDTRHGCRNRRAASVRGSASQRGWEMMALRAERWILIGCLLAATLSLSSGSTRGGIRSHPRLIADSADVVRARQWLRESPWYRSIIEEHRQSIEAFIARRPVYVSPIKQIYQYKMYSCPTHDAELLYEEFSPFVHRCPQDTSEHYSGGKYDAAWAGWYNRELASRLVWLGILYQLYGEERYADAGREILMQFADLYLKYPTTNTILGPAHVFFGTLSESFWGVDMAYGYDLLHDSPGFSEADHGILKEQLFLPLARITQRFPESASNRQLWYNNVSAAVGFLYDDQELIEFALRGTYGFEWQLGSALPASGFWPEWSGYHFVALRGMIHLAEMARHNGLDLYHRTIAGTVDEGDVRRPLRDHSSEL